MPYATALVALGGFSLGAALSRALAVTFPLQLNSLFDSPAAFVPAVIVAGITTLAWQQVGHRAARRTARSPTEVLKQDALAHLPLLVLLPVSISHIVTVGLTLLLGSSPLALGWDTDPTHVWVLPVGAFALLIAFRVRLAVRLGLLPRAWGDRLLRVALFAIPFAIYLCTLTPGIGTKDGFELQVVSATLGIAHPTGYPLFTLLGRLFVALLPVGSPAYRINLMCALFAAASVPLIYAIGLRVLRRRPPAALAALVFAFTPTFWTQASIPEKYTLNVLFVTLVVLLAVRWAQETSEHKERWFYGLAFAYGLSLTHHRTMLLLAPALIIWVLSAEPGLLRQPKRLLIALGLFSAPLLLYLYLPWRAYAQGWQMTWPEFLAQISGSEYAPALRLNEWLTSPERRATYLRFLRHQFGYVGIGLGMLGWLSLWRRQWRFALLSTVAWITYVIFSLGYHAYYNDVNYFLPSHLVFALWLGTGLDEVGKQIRLWRHTPHDMRVYWTLIALLPLFLIWTHLSEVDMSQAQNDLPWAEYVLNLDLPPNATILADSVKVAPLHYLTTVEQKRPDVNVVVLPDETAYVKTLEAHLVQGLPVYLARYLPNLGGAYHLRSLGPLVEVSLNPLTDLPALAYPLEADFEGGIQLLGYDAPTLTSPRQGVLHITLYWQPTGPVPESYRPRLRLIDPQGHVWWEEEEHLPVSDHYPTNAWRPGEVIPDYHGVPIEGVLQPGDYRLELGLFRPFAETGLSLDGKGADHATLGTVTVSSGWVGKPERISHRLLTRRAPHLMLIGADVPEQVRPGGWARLRLYWLPVGPLPDYEFHLSLRHPELPGATSKMSKDTRYTSSTWPIGKVMITQHTIDMPGVPSGSKARVMLHLSEDDEFVPHRYPDLAWLHIEGPPVTRQKTAVNFGDQILLLDYDLPQKEVHPGELFEMAINWQGLADMDEDYTIFVHLLGPDGLLRGQVDVWPHDGTYPTSTWPVSEVIADTYRVLLDDDAPPGAYSVEVGVYLLRTMGRLPVLNANGRPVDDKLLIEGLTVKE